MENALYSFLLGRWSLAEIFTMEGGAQLNGNVQQSCAGNKKMNIASKHEPSHD